ncbi:MAG: nucleotidyltransferase domain-containing protein [Deltaproteobacteria bacterium]|nr:nucleotidyltransferase domain-containing protein [Deltaproteobacteria bacterium]
MENEHDLFFSILISLGKAEVLRDVILIGGWCPLVYKEYFGNPVEISVQRTADLDILVPNPPRIHKEVDVSLILKELGFDRKVSPLDGYEKYVHPDLEVEFLTPERGKGREKPYVIDKLHINAQGLRYLDLIQSHVMKTSFRGISLNVPEPTAYVLHKFIISGRRKKSFKKEKDIETARQIGEYLLELENQRKKMRKIYLGMPEKWKKNLMKIIKGASGKIHTFFNSLEN